MQPTYSLSLIIVVLLAVLIIIENQFGVGMAAERVRIR